MTSHHLHSCFFFAFVNNVCLLKTPPLGKTLETNPIIFKCCDCYQLISFHNCSPNSTFHKKIHLVKPFLEASLILWFYDSNQTWQCSSKKRALRYQIQNDKSAVYELSLCPSQIKALKRKTIVISELVKRKRAPESINSYPCSSTSPWNMLLQSFIRNSLAIRTAEMRMIFDGKGNRKTLPDSQEHRIAWRNHLSILLNSYSLTAQDEDLVSESNVAAQLFHPQNNFVIHRPAAFQVKKIACFHKHALGAN